jgi:hypothetical protein
VIGRLEALMKCDTAGDPITGLKWSRRTMAKIAAELKTVGIDVSPNTVAKLLKKLDFRPRVNHKKLSSGSGPERDQQFGYITEIRERFGRDDLPIISVDSKKRELVGLFKNPGTAWHRQPILVNDHDFRSQAQGVAIPYGVYDEKANRGSVFVGTSHDTSEFAAESIERWWRYDGRRRYPKTDHLLILADAGGSNSATRRTWKHALQTKLCDRHQLSVTVTHYPAGASKWNPIEHRLFSEISKNWAGEPLRSYETILNYIRTTKTTTGLRVKAYLVKKQYPKSVKISDRQMQKLALEKHKTLPKWNYTLAPRENGK